MRGWDGSVVGGDVVDLAVGWGRVSHGWVNRVGRGGNGFCCGVDDIVSGTADVDKDSAWAES